MVFHERLVASTGRREEPIDTDAASEANVPTFLTRLVITKRSRSMLTFSTEVLLQQVPKRRLDWVSELPFVA